MPQYVNSMYKTLDSNNIGIVLLGDAMPFPDLSQSVNSSWKMSLHWMKHWKLPMMP